MLRRSRTQDFISLKYRLCPISQSGRAVPGVDMPRASRFVITASVLICLITLDAGGWLKSSLSAMSAGASMYASRNGADWIPPFQRGTKLVDRLLRRPVFAGADPTPSGTALRFDGVDDYVTFGPATAALGSNVFTLEVWFMREGTGVTASTGTGGVVAVPLIAKGVAETDNHDTK